MADSVQLDDTVTVEMLVCVTSYGKADQVRTAVERETRRRLEHSFGDRVTVLVAPDCRFDEAEQLAS